MEQRCLAQLDQAENWRMLNRQRPPEDEILPWNPFRRIFGFNLAVFAVVIAVLLVAVSSASGMEKSEMIQSENLIPEILFVATTSAIMALLAAGLYRRSWNRRARHLLRQTSDWDG